MKVWGGCCMKGQVAGEVGMHRGAQRVASSGQRVDRGRERGGESRERHDCKNNGKKDERDMIANNFPLTKQVLNTAQNTAQAPWTYRFRLVPGGACCRTLTVFPAGPAAPCAPPRLEPPRPCPLELPRPRPRPRPRPLPRPREGLALVSVMWGA